MQIRHILQFVLLAAIWGSSFLFLRMAVPVVGAAPTAFFRLLIAAIFLFIVCFFSHKKLNFRDNYKYYLIIGLINSALPFYFYSLAARNTSVSVLAVINAMSPMWGAIFSYFFAKQKMSFGQIAGLFIGALGVAILVGLDPNAENFTSGFILALLATACYGLASTYNGLNQKAKNIDPTSTAHGSLWVAAIFLLPFLLFSPPSQIPSSKVIFAILGLGVLCSGIAYIIFFRLITQIGAPATLTVTFLIPVFGILWGWTFLDEKVTWNTLLGTVVVIFGSMLVNKIFNFDCFKIKSS